MQKFLPIIVILIAGIAGGGGGYFFKLQASQGGGEKHADVGAHAEEEGHGDKKDKKKKNKGGHGEADASSTVYMKFGRQFVVPVVKNGKPKSIMIMDIIIEVSSEQGETVYAYEPRLRDALLSHLIVKAGQGDLPLMLEDTAMMEETKAELLAISKTIIGDGALQVLIQDIGMQNY